MLLMTAMLFRVHFARSFECQAGSRRTRTSQRPHASLPVCGGRGDGPVVQYILFITTSNVVCLRSMDVRVVPTHSASRSRLSASAHSHDVSICTMIVGHRRALFGAV
ncbi:hypothetical protein BD413DRAFT_580899 [Trametes elegans]|nr:hypothetical protein BD413DRAFT_580899 [Trametes elegans]